MMKKTLLFFVLLFIANLSIAQEVKATLSKKNVQLGEYFQIQFEIEIQSEDKIIYAPQKEKLVALASKKNSIEKDTFYLEINGAFLEKNEKIQGKLFWQGTYTVTSFEEGLFVIPPHAFRLNGKAIMSNPLLLQVNLVAKKKDVDLYDIEESFEELPSPFYEQAKKVILWSLFTLLLIGLVFGYILFLRKKSKQQEVVPTPPNSNTIKKMAIADLNALMEQKLWEKDELKEHFTQLSLIARRYLGKEMGSSYLEKTSLEIQLLLRKKGCPERWLQSLGLILNVSDMVKFAKSSVEAEGIYSIYDMAKSFIEEFEIS